MYVTEKDLDQQRELIELPACTSAKNATVDVNQPSSSGNIPFIECNVEQVPVLNENQEVTLTSIQNNQLKIMAGIAYLTTSVDVLNEKVASIEKHVQAAPIATLADEPFKPVDSMSDLILLESELKEEVNMKRYIQKLSTVCGSSGKSNGIDCAYRLIDFVATREFIHSCSWTGLAREPTESDANQPGTSNAPEGSASKIPLKFYSKFRELFSRVIRLADNEFSDADSDKFLKGVLKNSKQRLTSKVTSTHKNRPKNLKYCSKFEQPK